MKGVTRRVGKFEGNREGEVVAWRGSGLVCLKRAVS